jgi:molybdopterin-guanine dinucleotide biosynthesis protein A
MQAAGYVLAGGASRRMGADKALLPFRGATLIESVAGAVREATGSITIVGSPEKYQGLGMRVIPDLRSGLGPLGGIETALADAREEWALVAACDMPCVTAGFFEDLLHSSHAPFDAVIPVTPDGRLHPLAALYRRSAKRVVSAALDKGIRKVLDAIQVLKIQHFPVAELINANTPDEWAAIAN